MSRRKRLLGLMLYELISARFFIVVMFILSMTAGIAVLITGIPFLLNIFAGTSIIAISCAVAMNLHRDIASRWNRFQPAMPVKRKDMITAHYLGYLIMLLVAILFTLLVVSLSLLIHSDLGDWLRIRSLMAVPHIFWSVALQLVLVNIGSVLLIGAVFFPVSYLIRATGAGGELLFVACVLVAIGMGSLTWSVDEWVDERWGYTSVNYAGVVIHALLLLVMVLAFATSYICTVKICESKDLH